MTWTNEPKNTTDWDIDAPQGTGLIWSDADIAWSEMTMTWEQLDKTPWSLLPKNTASWANQPKS